MNFDILLIFDILRYIHKSILIILYSIIALWLLSYIDNDEGSVRDSRNNPNSPNAYVKDWINR